ncbi:sigma-70 family RNA polymerase sigma factor [Halorubrum sp. SS5]|nr:sigma-70 family RNA polymerase sigma factor [Halorubrum sp. SS5]
MNQTRLSAFEPDLSPLTEAERDAYEAVRLGEMGPREFQRDRGYASPGTVSNLLRRAEDKLHRGAT